MSRLAMKMKSCGKTRREICEQTGTDRKTVSRQCRDGIRTTRVAQRYAKVLAESVHEDFERVAMTLQPKRSIKKKSS